MSKGFVPRFAIVSEKNIMLCADIVAASQIMGMSTYKLNTKIRNGEIITSDEGVLYSDIFIIKSKRGRRK
jgi:hypothetical protein